MPFTPTQTGIWLCSMISPPLDKLAHRVSTQASLGRMQVRRPISPPRGGEIGLLTCILPSEACVLTLCASLSKGGEIIEQSQIPVCVGVKGMLEAAF